MIERLLCALFGHKYVVQMVFSSTSRKIGCTRCSREWGMHDPTRSLMAWDGELEDAYKGLGQRPSKKRGNDASSTARP